MCRFAGLWGFSSKVKNEDFFFKSGFKGFMSASLGCVDMEVVACM